MRKHTAAASLGEIGKLESCAEDDVMKPIFLDDLREDWVGLRACEDVLELSRA